MSLDSMNEYWVPEHMKEHLRELGSVLPSTIWSLGFDRGTTGWVPAGTSTTIVIRMGLGAYTRFIGGRFTRR